MRAWARSQGASGAYFKRRLLDDQLASHCSETTGHSLAARRRSIPNKGWLSCPRPCNFHQRTVEAVCCARALQRCHLRVPTQAQGHESPPAPGQLC